MLSRAGRSLNRLHRAQRAFRAHSTTSARTLALTGTSAAAAVVVVASGVVWYSSTRVIANDAQSSPSSTGPVKNALFVNSGDGLQDGELHAVVWGSNKANIISPSTPEIDSVAVPSVAKWLDGVALRDLVAHERHAACVDARGDVYQWGSGFFGPSVNPDAKPKLTLKGKDITQLQVTATKVFALSSSGEVYVLSSDAARQELSPGQPTPSSSPWWGTGWFWGEDQVVNFAEITPNVALSRGEIFVSISAGLDHLLALTSTGRAFAYPVTKNANAYGQLGLRRITLPSPSLTLPATITRLEAELIPKFSADPFAQSTPYTRPKPSPRSSDDSPKKEGDLSKFDDADIKFCDRLFEVPSLKGIKIAQIAAGGRSSFALTDNGRVLGWGANEYGQIGLGSRVRLNAVIIPSEVVLGPQGTKCLNVYAGGDLTCFVVERSGGLSGPSTVDLLLCGNGQWGGLGNNSFSNAQSDPIRSKAVSGLVEFNERSKSLEAILPHAVSVSPVGHVLLTLDTLARSGSGVGGRDLIVWGSNYDYQLGLGKRGSVATPTPLSGPDGTRCMLMQRQAESVKDLGGKVWKRRVMVEQKAVGLYGSSIVYWRIS